jgi:hypothetical protein
MEPISKRGTGGIIRAAIPPQASSCARRTSPIGHRRFVADNSALMIFPSRFLLLVGATGVMNRLPPKLQAARSLRK